MVSFVFFDILQLPHTVISNSEKLTHPIEHIHYLIPWETLVSTVVTILYVTRSQESRNLSNRKALLCNSIFVRVSNLSKSLTTSHSESLPAIYAATPQSVPLTYSFAQVFCSDSSRVPGSTYTAHCSAQ